MTNFSNFSALVLEDIDLTLSLYKYTPFPILLPKSSKPFQEIDRDKFSDCTI